MRELVSLTARCIGLKPRAAEAEYTAAAIRRAQHDHDHVRDVLRVKGFGDAICRRARAVSGTAGRDRCRTPPGVLSMTCQLGQPAAAKRIGGGRAFEWRAGSGTVAAADCASGEGDDRRCAGVQKQAAAEQSELAERHVGDVGCGGQKPTEL